MSTLESACITETRTEKLSFFWVIKDFHLFSEQLSDAIYSSPFPPREEHDGEWYLKLSQRTADDGLQYLSIFLFYTGVPDVHAEAAFCIVDASGQEWNKQRTNVRLFSRYRGSWGFYKFIPISALECNICHSLAEGDLGIHCAVTVIDGYTSVPARCETASAEVPQCRLTEDLGWLLDSGDHADLTVKVCGGTYRVHKSLLASRSPVFRAMLSHEMLEAQQGEITIPDIDYDVFGALLCFIYTGRTQNLGDLAASLLAAADKYGLLRLRDMCEEALVEGMNAENATSALVLADQHNAATLRRTAIDFIAEHGSEVTETPGWHALTVNRADLVTEVVRALCGRGDSSGERPAKRSRTT